MIWLANIWLNNYWGYDANPFPLLFSFPAGRSTNKHGYLTYIIISFCILPG